MAGTIIVTRHFSVEIYGYYTLILVIVTFLTQFSNFGLETSISRFLASTPDDTKKENLFGTAIVVRLFTTFLACIFAWVGMPLISKLFGGSLLPNLLIYVPVIYSLESLRSLLKSILEGSFRFSRIGIADVILYSVNFILILALVYFIKGDIHTLLLTRVLSGILSIIYAYFSVPIKKKLIFTRSLFKELIKFGYPLQINSILTFIYTRIDTIMIGAMLGAADIAFYENARTIPDGLRNMYEPFRAVYFPSLSKKYSLGEKLQANKLLNDSSRFVSFITILGAAITLLFGENIIRLIFSDKYLPSAPAFNLLMFSLSIALTSNVLGISLVAVGDSDKPMIINVVHTIASIVANAILIPPFGIFGAAIASVIGNAAAYPPNLFFLKKKLPASVLPFLKPVLIYWAWAIVVFLIHPSAFFVKIAFLLIFLAACGILSVVNKEDLTALMEASGISSWATLRRFLLGEPKI